jgi:hypothetical protein
MPRGRTKAKDRLSNDEKAAGSSPPVSNPTGVAYDTPLGGLEK